MLPSLAFTALGRQPMSHASKALIHSKESRAGAVEGELINAGIIEIDVQRSASGKRGLEVWRELREKSAPETYCRGAAKRCLAYCVHDIVFRAFLR
ncbi:MAG: hypothetical protein EON59_17340 [Alphaproteobacteria bacterium]|nr:MAG: hypothetical protein EON59_17340 [Alphaproteobacteria bacterium]